MTETSQRARLRQVAESYASDAAKFRDMARTGYPDGIEPEFAERMALVDANIAREIRKVAGAGPTTPLEHEGDRRVTPLSPDADLAIDSSLCIVLRTPERRVTVGDVARWIEGLRQAKVFQQIYEEER